MRLASALLGSTGLAASADRGSPHMLRPGAWPSRTSLYLIGWTGVRSTQCVRTHDSGTQSSEVVCRAMTAGPGEYQPPCLPIESRSPIESDS